MWQFVVLAAAARAAVAQEVCADQNNLIQSGLVVHHGLPGLLSHSHRAIAPGPAELTVHGCLANSSSCRPPVGFDVLTAKDRWHGWRHLSNNTVSHASLPVHDDAGINFFRSAPAAEWVILAVSCAVACLIDYFALSRLPDTFRWHMVVIVVWFLVALVYLAALWVRMGPERGIQWISGYVLEWMLSMDNLFVFHLVFKTYKTPPNQVHRAVFVGIIGAVVMRLVFFMVVSTLLHAFGWFRWPFGLLLVWSGIEALRGEEDDDEDVKDTLLVRTLRKCLGSRIYDDYDESAALVVWEKGTGRLQVTVLLVVILVIEFSDIIFALDSVSAKVAQIPNQFIAFSSSVLAMYGLRAMFFIVQDLVESFDLLKYGLGLILVWIGVELMFGRWIHVSSALECILIVAVFVLCMVASSVKNAFFPAAKEEASNASEDASDHGDDKSATDPTKTPDTETPQMSDRSSDSRSWPRARHERHARTEDSG
mmetsp:Transcript_93791/g.265236  ORF Transcript_93791/g.265236 Transcript_93791/m.265236 type:complete len:480 (-) Transcript_93791:117-1556(-)